MAESLRDGAAAAGAKWRPGELEWEAWMRVLDSAVSAGQPRPWCTVFAQGCRSGHVYRQPAARGKAPGAQSDVEVPPAASAFGLLPPADQADAS